MSSSSNKCHNTDTDIHSDSLSEVVCNDTGDLIHVCASCLSGELQEVHKYRCATCALCGSLHLGKTLQRPSVFIFSKNDADDESFCFECVGTELPKFMCNFFTRHPDEKAMWEEYYKKFKVPTDMHLDFTSPDTLFLTSADGVAYPSTTGMFGHVLYLIAKEVPAVRYWIDGEFLYRLEQRRLKNECPRQIMRDMCDEEATAMLSRVIPSSVGSSVAFELLPPAIRRNAGAVILRDMRRVDNFYKFIDFLKKHK